MKNVPIFTNSNYVFLQNDTTLNPNRITFTTIDKLNTNTVKIQVWEPDTKVPTAKDISCELENNIYYITKNNIINTVQSVNESFEIEDDIYYHIRLGIFDSESSTINWSSIANFKISSDLKMKIQEVDVSQALDKPLTFNINLDDSNSELCTDIIDSYRIFITKANGRILYSSQIINNNYSNKISFTTPFVFYNQQDSEYSVQFVAVTKYGNIIIIHKNFTINNAIPAEYNNLILNIQNHEDLGVNRLTLSINSGGPEGILLWKIYRKKTEDEWWHLVKTIYASVNGFIWDDRTIEAEQEYNYSVFFEYSGTNYQIFNTSGRVYFFDDFLTGPTAQLRIQYTKELSNYKYNVSDTITPTVGSQYPFARRVANTNYRTFTISGLITYNLEKFNREATTEDSMERGEGFDKIEHEVFEQIFHDGVSNDSPSIVFNKKDTKIFSTYSEVKRERLFREAVIKFLYSNPIKMFRSATEGNIFVKITNVSLTPEKQLNRQIYSFSATATEIDEINDETLEKYNFISEESDETKEIRITTLGVELDSLTPSEDIVTLANAEDILTEESETKWVRLHEFIDQILF